MAERGRRARQNLRAFAAILLCGCALAPPATADDAEATDQLLDFVANGCIQSAIAEAPVKVFAAARDVTAADEKTASAILGKDKGTVYLNTDPAYPLALAERPGAPCTVNAKFPGDLTAMIAAVKDFIAGPGGGFYPVRVFEEQAAPSSWTTHRIFLGRRRGKNLTLLFSTTPGVATFDQVMVAVAETQP